ncbi:MAG: arginine deiminase family protein [Arenicellales bacterium]|nr:arginine deiminase family protein [Arenicellales bacterium]
MTDPLRRVALRRPGSALLNADAALWHYGPGFDPERVCAEHASLTNLLKAAGVEIVWMDNDDKGIADAVFTYDASLMTPKGAILMSPGKRLRAGEQELHRAFYASQDIPILGEIKGEGRAEAGDTLWLDTQTLAVGRGFRTNQGGIEQLKALLASIDVAVYEFDLPVYHGAEACLHLMSLVSIVDTKTALVYAPLFPVGLWELMGALGFNLIETPHSDFAESITLSNNVLAISPGQCIMINGFPKTKNTLETAGIGVQVFDGNALCIGCEGGPTCLTLPLLRG